MSTLRNAGIGGIGAAFGAVIATTVTFTPGWEGMDKVAKRDMIGTGHPITYCYGQTDEFGKVKVGTRFTKAQCDAKLAESLPKYLERLNKCIHVPLPVKSVASLLDASYNAGTGAVCKSPMLARMNAGNIRGGCEAFRGWYVRSDGKVRNGLIARRSGIGDGRKSERDLCLEGLNEPKDTWYSPSPSAVPAPPDAKPKKTRPKWLTTFKTPQQPKPYVCTARQAEAGECLPLVPPKVCGGEWVDDRSYTSHPECRRPAPPKSTPAPAPAAKCEFPWIFAAACFGSR